MGGGVSYAVYNLVGEGRGVVAGSVAGPGLGRSRGRQTVFWPWSQITDTGDQASLRKLPNWILSITKINWLTGGGRLTERGRWRTMPAIVDSCHTVAGELALAFNLQKKPRWNSCKDKNWLKFLGPSVKSFQSNRKMYKPENIYWAPPPHLPCEFGLKVSCFHRKISNLSLWCEEPVSGTTDRLSKSS